MRGVVTMAVLLVIGLTGCGKTTTASNRTTTTASTVAQNVEADKAAAEAALLKLSDLPAGWTSIPASDPSDNLAPDTDLATCLGVSVAELNRTGPADVRSPTFRDTDSRSITNRVSYPPTVAEAQRTLALFMRPQTRGCLGTGLSTALNDELKNPSDPADTLPADTTFSTPKVEVLPFPTVGDHTVAYRTSVVIKAVRTTVTVYADLVVSLKGRVVIEMDFESGNTPFPTDKESNLVQTVGARLTNTGP